MDKEKLIKSIKRLERMILEEQFGLFSEEELQEMRLERIKELEEVSSHE